MAASSKAPAFRWPLCWCRPLADSPSPVGIEGVFTWAMRGEKDGKASEKQIHPLTLVSIIIAGIVPVEFDHSLL